MSMHTRGHCYRAEAGLGIRHIRLLQGEGLYLRDSSEARSPAFNKRSPILDMQPNTSSY